MSKRRKTRQEKIVADLRRNQFAQENAITSAPTVQHHSSSFSLPSSYMIPKQRTLPGAYDTYKYVYMDLRNTAIVTCTLLIIQCILYYVLQKHLVVLPFVTY